MSIQPRILVVTNRYPNRYKCYAGMHVKRHVLLHEESGLNVTVLTPGDSRQGAFRSTWKYTLLSLHVLRAMLFADFDLVHAHWILPAGLFGAVLSRSRRVPFVLTSHGALIDDLVSRLWPMHGLVRMVLRTADVVIAVGQEHKRKIEAIAQLPHERVRSINMGIWLGQSPINRVEARRALALPRGERIVIYLGNLEKVKGLDVLVKAASTLIEWGYQFRLVIGGQGPEKQNILEAIDRLEIEETTRVIGAIMPEDVFTWLSAADVCVVPSRAETFGLVAMESMACGTVVVAADVGGLSENIKHGENGFLFPVGDHIALAKCLQEVLANDGLRERVAERGRQTAASHDMRLQAAKVKEIYEELLYNRHQTLSDGDEK